MLVIGLVALWGWSGAERSKTAEPVVAGSAKQGPTKPLVTEEPEPALGAAVPDASAAKPEVTGPPSSTQKRQPVRRAPSDEDEPLSNPYKRGK